MTAVSSKPYGFIYKTILPGGRFYIGQHKIISQKTLDPNYFGSGVIIRDYIKSKGKKFLSREILCFGFSLSEMNKLESEFITEELLNDPMCINLDKGGRNKYTRYTEVNQKISKSMASLRKSRGNSWGSLKGENNNFSKKWLLISPDGTQYNIVGCIKEFCESHGISANTMKAAIRAGWIPKRGKCSGWIGYDLTTGRGTTRATMNQGEAIRGVNNPYYGGKKRNSI